MNCHVRRSSLIGVANLKQLSVLEPFVAILWRCHTGRTFVTISGLFLSSIALPLPTSSNHYTSALPSRRDETYHNGRDVGDKAAGSQYRRPRQLLPAFPFYLEHFLRGPDSHSAALWPKPSGDISYRLRKAAYPTHSSSVLHSLISV